MSFKKYLKEGKGHYVLSGMCEKNVIIFFNVVG